MSDPVLHDPRCPRCRGTGLDVHVQSGRAIGALCGCRLSCPLCSDRGWREVVVDGVPRTGRCRCQKVPDRLALFTDLGIPARHADASFDTFDPARCNALFPVFSWVRGFRPGGGTRGLVLWGDVGRGKTHLAVAAARKLVMDHGLRARFIEFSHLLSQLKAGFDAGQGQEAVLHELVQLDLLVIDELGKGRNTEWEQQVIDELVSRRYNALRPILATTNYAPGRATGLRDVNLATAEGAAQTLADRLGERVYSRIRAMCDLVEVAGVDNRLIQAGRG